ncbi:hypothetical protein Ate02nite_84340 [Paractinoplanes tereljensis]|uniref:Uncharacterized protein n=1 Tax=Paractinoplanes tereljensis TaxID=571912 RepID=A0A919NUX5_9ACTN|nr:hypothetical protein Ate02nite_84340 [Actinoplanes tereljensis]
MLFEPVTGERLRTYVATAGGGTDGREDLVREVDLDDGASQRVLLKIGRKMADRIIARGYDNKPRNSLADAPGRGVPASRLPR